MSAVRPGSFPKGCDDRSQTAKGPRQPPGPFRWYAHIVLMGHLALPMTFFNRLHAVSCIAVQAGVPDALFTQGAHLSHLQRPV